MSPYRMSTYVQVVLPLVLADLLQDGQVLLLDAVILRLLPIHWLLLFHLIVVQVFNVLLNTNPVITFGVMLLHTRRQANFLHHHPRILP